MERSSDVETVVRRMYEGIRRGDADAVIELVAEDGVVFVGTDADDWWRDDLDALHAAIREQLGTTEGFDMFDEDPVCYSDGDFAWFSDQPSIRLPDGAVVPMRQTGALRRLDGEWRIVLSHLSVAANVNERLFGEG